MLLRKSYTLFLLSCCCLFLQVAVNKIFAQNSTRQSQDQLQVRFLHDSLEIDENSFQFNNSTILYTGSKSINAEVQIEAPKDVKIISPLTANFFTLQPNQPQIIPIRFIANSNSAVWQAVTLNLLIKESSEIIRKQFWIKLKPHSKWRCNLLSPAILITDKEASTTFGIWIENGGNVPQTYTVKLETNLLLEKPGNKTELTLNPGEGRTVNFTALTSFFKKEKVNNETVVIHVRNKSGEERLLLQKINILGSFYEKDHAGWKQMPLAVELSAQKLAEGKTIYTANLNGQVKLNEEKSFYINAQLNNFSTNAFYNNLYAVGYRTSNWNFKGGSIVGFNHFIMNGNGIAVEHSDKRKSYELTLLKSRLSNTNQINFIYAGSIRNKIDFSSNNFSNQDEDKKMHSSFSIQKADWKISSSTTLKLQGGIGVEKLRAKHDTSLYGTVFGYQFETRWKSVFFSSQVENYTKNFPGFNKGFQFHNHEVRKQIGRFNLGTYWQANKKIYTNTDDSLLNQLLNINNKEYGFKTGFHQNRFSFSFSLGQETQQQDSLHAMEIKMWKTAANLNWRITPDLRFFLFSNAGRITVTQRQDIKPFWSMVNYGNLQRKNIGINFQWNTGPYYYFEVKDFVRQKQSFGRLQLSPYLELENKSKGLFNRVQVTYNQEQPNSQDHTFLINHLTFSPERLKTDFSLLTNFNFTNLKRSFINVSVRKKLSVPVYKNSNSYSFNLLLFKDKNNNGTFEQEQDEVIPSAIITADRKLVQTSAQGEILFRNLNAEPIQLDFSNINQLKGWIPRDGLKQVVLPTKKDKIHYIPFKESRSISGRLAVISDEKSNNKLDLNHIRISATDIKGNTFSTLTDNDGNFYFNLPAGDYIISLNPSVFDEQFRPTETSKTADLMNNNNIQLIFEIRQKKRVINIQKSND